MIERRAVTVRVRRGGSDAVTRRDDLTVEPKKMRSNFSFRRVSEVMEGVRLQGIRATTSRTNLQVNNFTYLLFILTAFICPTTGHRSLHLHAKCGLGDDMSMF